MPRNKIKYVTDYFYEHGHRKTTVKIMIINISFWIFIILPFLFLIYGVFIGPQSYIVDDFIKYTAFMFGCWVFGIGGAWFIISVMNDRSIKKNEDQKIMYNQAGVKKKKIVLRNYFNHKFSPDFAYRQNYTVDYHNNLPLNEFQKLYRRNKINKYDGK